MGGKEVWTRQQLTRTNPEAADACLLIVCSPFSLPRRKTDMKVCLLAAIVLLATAAWADDGQALGGDSTFSRALLASR